jgi:BON domain-containing protein
MARDFEDLHDVEDLSDDELRELVRSHLAAHNALDIDDLDVTVTDGLVCLDGRVGTDAERNVAEHVVTDVLGVTRLENRIFIDPVRRAESPEAIDDHLADEEKREGLLLGDRPVPLSPEVEQVADSLDAELYGTTDVQKAIEEGTGWIPPESPTPEGLSERGEIGEDH